MKNDLTEILMIVDESSSMTPHISSTMEGFNSFVDTQKLVPGDANLTLIFFSDTARTYPPANIKEVKHISAKDYMPCGCTALYDALGKGIDSLGLRLREMKEEDRPAKVIVMVITDGEENSSKIYTQSQIKEMIQTQKEVYSWEFIFFGANEDALYGGQQIGIDNNFRYDISNTKGMYASASVSVANYRSTGSIDGQLSDS